MFKRYAIYHLPEADLAQRGANWLGWDAQTGRPVPQPDLPGLDLADLTQTPRRYGLHATIKPPFRLSDPNTQAGLEAAIAAFCATTPAVTLAGLDLTRLGRFLALTPAGDAGALNALASRVVTEFDSFRAAMTPEERARRNPDRLSEAQRATLDRWGYPFVMDHFRFHITLTGRLQDPEPAIRAAAAHFAPALEGAYQLASLSLCGEDSEGRFHQIRRFALQDAA